MSTDQAGSGVSTVETEVLADEFLGLPAALSVLRNELNRCGLSPDVHRPLAQRIKNIRQGVIDLQRTLLRERKADIWVADAWVSRADFDRVMAEFAEAKEQIAEYEAAEIGKLRSLIESHCDAARGEWSCR